ncbi:hypothetical protein BDP27DRAFT_1336629 [Rhodocollybia butyracea]|uniref:Uncharacterized protein n=1 Tax=Rhodocollybia butyracea TaxID=206335 RepID=A0A9P5U1G6_9AGAR|nr:hypothetical protein BDP27DRAFT_1336629 [Rhodocollybia butyracea]
MPLWVGTLSLTVFIVAVVDCSLVRGITMFLVELVLVVSSWMFFAIRTHKTHQPPSRYSSYGDPSHLFCEKAKKSGIASLCIEKNYIQKFFLDCFSSLLSSHR